MCKIEITLERAKSLYNTASPEDKKFFEDEFGVNNFKPKTIFDKVKSFEDALAITDETPEKFQYRTQYHSKDSSAYEKLKIIISVMNEGWIPNWKDSSEYKWYPWFDLGGSGFSLYACSCQNSFSGVGVRLYTKNEDLCRYIATQFIDIYKDYMTIE